MNLIISIFYMNCVYYQRKIFQGSMHIVEVDKTSPNLNAYCSNTGSTYDEKFKKILPKHKNTSFLVVDSEPIHSHYYIFQIGRETIQEIHTFLKFLKLKTFFI